MNIGWRNRTCNVDTYVVERIRNSFISTISFYRAIEYCFQELNMHRINLFVYAFNTRSWRIIEKKSQAKRELELHKQVAGTACSTTCTAMASSVRIGSGSAMISRNTSKASTSPA